MPGTRRKRRGYVTASEGGGLNLYQCACVAAGAKLKNEWHWLLSLTWESCILFLCMIGLAKIDTLFFLILILIFINHVTLIHF